MADLSGLDLVEVDQGRTGSYDFEFDDIHDDTDVTNELYDNAQDVRGDTYFTGSTVNGQLVLPDLVDSSGTDQTSTLITMMTGDDYHRLQFTRFDGATLIVDKTKIRVMQDTIATVGDIDAWQMMFRDVDTTGIFYYS